jgi:transcriptional regulator with XRE-family HTH domain
MQETIGRRVARLRQETGWTQQALATRLAISRVAISHIEMDLILPSERTITLLAGLFKCTPHDLVEDTTYPLAKAERLPEVACSYTALEVDLALLDNDLTWLKRLNNRGDRQIAETDIRERWTSRLDTWGQTVLDEREKKLLATARKKLRSLLS